MFMHSSMESLSDAVVYFVALCCFVVVVLFCGCCVVLWLLCCFVVAMLLCGCCDGLCCFVVLWLLCCFVLIFDLRVEFWGVVS